MISTCWTQRVDNPMVENIEDAADSDGRIAALKRNIVLQKRLIEGLLARRQSVTVAGRMLQRLEARLAQLELRDRQRSESATGETLRDAQNSGN